MQKFSVIIVGCGNIAGGYDAQPTASDWPLTHAGAFSADPHFEIVACCDPDAIKRVQFQQKWNIPLAVANLAEFADLGNSVDIVCLCSPTVAHAEQLQTVLAWQPKLVFCEKPLVALTDDATYCLKQYTDAAVPLVVNYSRRWAADICALQQELARGDWGKVRSVSGVYNKGLLNNGGHMIDLMHFLFGVMCIKGVGSAVYDYWDNDPSVPVLLETQSGIPIALNIAHAQDYVLFEMEIVTERGVLKMLDGGSSWIKRGVLETAQLGAIEHADGYVRETMTAAVDNLYKILSQGDVAPSTGKTASMVHELCCKIMRAAESSQSSLGENDE